MASSNPPLGFMDLPAEVRLRVYGYLFTSPEPVGTVGRRSQQFYTANLSAQLLCCNKIILTEALPLLFTQNDFVVSHHGDLPKLKRLAPTRTDKAFIHQLCFYGFRLLTKARVREILPLRNLQKITIQSVWYSRFDSIEAITTSKMLQEIADGFATPLSQARPTMSITANVLIKCSCRGMTPHLEIDILWKLRSTGNAAAKAIVIVEDVRKKEGAGTCQDPLLVEWADQKG